jgi:hypothetical protein
MVAASSADAPAACSSALAISIRRSAGTFGMASSYLFVAWLALLGWPAEPGR